MKRSGLRWMLCILLLGAGTEAAAADFDYGNYEEVLGSHLRQGVIIEGVTVNALDYSRLKKDATHAVSAYNMLLGQLSAFDPATLSSRKEKMAFWINVYNIAAVKTLVDHYPVDSIRSSKIHWLGLPWNRNVITVGGKEYTLAQIEFDLLVEGFRDLRVHFGINCASVSCVDLLPEPFRAEKLDRQLEEQGRQFLANSQKGMRIDREKNQVYLSQVFKFDKKHFNEYAGGALPFILPYLSEEDRSYLQTAEPDIEYLDYNWKANDTAVPGDR